MSSTKPFHLSCNSSLEWLPSPVPWSQLSLHLSSFQPITCTTHFIPLRLLLVSPSSLSHHQLPWFHPCFDVPVPQPFHREPSHQMGPESVIPLQVHRTSVCLKLPTPGQAIHSFSLSSHDSSGLIATRSSFSDQDHCIGTGDADENGSSLNRSLSCLFGEPWCNLRACAQGVSWAHEMSMNFGYEDESNDDVRWGSLSDSGRRCNLKRSPVCTALDVELVSPTCRPVLRP